MATGALRWGSRIASFHRFVGKHQGPNGTVEATGAGSFRLASKRSRLDVVRPNSTRMVMASDGDWRLVVGHTNRFVPPLCLEHQGPIGKFAVTGAVTFRFSLRNHFVHNLRPVISLHNIGECRS